VNIKNWFGIKIWSTGLLLAVILCASSTAFAQGAAGETRTRPQWVVASQQTYLVSDLPLAETPKAASYRPKLLAEPYLIVDISPDASTAGNASSAADDPFQQDFQPDPFEADSGSASSNSDNNSTPFEKDPFEKEQEPIPPMADPWEGFNRSMFAFNDNLYVYVMKPVANTWRGVLNEEFRIAISNLFDNALAPAKLFSSLFQGKWDKSGRVVSRTVINTVFGFGGMLDVAGQEYGIENVSEDFGQALGFHRFKSGPYIVLPFLGPSSVRHTFGRVVDSILNPTFFFSPGFYESAGITAGNMINETSFRIEDFDTLRKEAIDPYESLRDFYHQYREIQIRE